LTYLNVIIKQRIFLDVSDLNAQLCCHVVEEREERGERDYDGRKKTKKNMLKG
jgi:hypothetical protein